MALLYFFVQSINATVMPLMEEETRKTEIKQKEILNII